MTKQEYKQLSHDIRDIARKRALSKGCSTRAELHNLFCWGDELNKDKFGNYHYTYNCIGDYEIGLVWEKTHNVCNDVYKFI